MQALNEVDLEETKEPKPVDEKYLLTSSDIHQVIGYLIQKNNGTFKIMNGDQNYLKNNVIKVYPKENDNIVDSVYYYYQANKSVNQTKR